MCRVTKFWVCDQVIDWLKEDGNLGPTELRKKLKETHKVDVTYRKVYLGKLFAMDKIYGSDREKQSWILCCN